MKKINKFIIQNETQLTDVEVFKIITHIIEIGKVSNNNEDYLILATLTHEEIHYTISCKRNKGSYKFRII